MMQLLNIDSTSLLLFSEFVIGIFSPIYLSFRRTDRYLVSLLSSNIAAVIIYIPRLSNRRKIEKR
jgi:hypothetical protein